MAPDTFLLTGQWSESCQAEDAREKNLGPGCVEGPRAAFPYAW